MDSYFDALASALGQMLPSDVFFTAWFSAESSDFIRFNHAKVRQAGHVWQGYLQVDLIKGKRHGLLTVSLSGKLDEDKERLRTRILAQCDALSSFEEDPYLLYATTPHSSKTIATTELPDAASVCDTIVRASAGLDFVGIHAQGTLFRGFANRLGQRNFMSEQTFHSDFCLYLSKDKAVKMSLAGKAWRDELFLQKIDEAKKQLEVLKRPAKTIVPGYYRAFLAPAAMQEMLSLLCWGGFSEKQVRTKQSSLVGLKDSDRSLHPSITWSENTAGGVGAPFSSGGFLRPDRVSLVSEGRFVSGLISPRTAQEYGLKTNGANSGEAPESLDMAPGSLAQSDVLSALGTGIYINNLWYLNFSDRPNCKMTGMTRFATFWVENGAIVAPLNVMRFDDSVYRMLGSNLVSLTQERSFLIDPGTYDERSTQSMHLPGALLSEMAFTL